MRRWLTAGLAATALAGAGLPAGAQVPETAGAVQGLTAGEWILSGTASYMAGARCASGETYFFLKAPQTVRVRRCVAGAWTSATLPWSVRPKPPTDVEVLIGGEPHVVKFRTAGGRRFMLLRRRSGDLKPSPTSEREFRLSED